MTAPLAFPNPFFYAPPSPPLEGHKTPWGFNAKGSVYETCSDFLPDGLEYLLYQHYDDGARAAVDTLIIPRDTWFDLDFWSLMTLLTFFPNIRTLCIDRLHSLTPSPGMHHFEIGIYEYLNAITSCCPQLRHLEILLYSLSDGSLQQLTSHSPPLPVLSTLHLGANSSSSTSLTHRELSILPHLTPALESLTFSHCITPEKYLSSTSILDRLKRLRTTHIIWPPQTVLSAAKHAPVVTVGSWADEIEPAPRDEPHPRSRASLSTRPSFSSMHPTTPRRGHSTVR